MRTIYDEIADDRIIRRAEVEYENELAAEYARSYWEGMSPYGDETVVPVVRLRDHNITEADLLEARGPVRAMTIVFLSSCGFIAALVIAAMIAA